MPAEAASRRLPNAAGRRIDGLADSQLTYTAVTVANKGHHETNTVVFRLVPENG
jgi:hypothetical protein